MLQSSFALDSVIFLTSLLFSFLLVPSLRRIAFHFNVIDIPNQIHKTHLEPIPYLGGFAILTPLLFFAFIGMLVAPNNELRLRLLIFFIPSVFISGLGLIDDKLNLPASTKLVFQIATSVVISLLLVSNGFTSGIFSDMFSNILVSVFWIVGMTNAFNLLDNVDGGAIGIAIIAGMSLYLLSVTNNQNLIALLTICFTGAAIGFFYWNAEPASIYLGDAGALFIGFFLSVLSLQIDTKAKTDFISVVIPLTIFALPVIDTAVVLTSRILSRKSIFQGGKDHLSHRIQNLGFSKRESNLVLWSTSAVFASLAIAINSSPNSLQNVLAISALILMAMFYFLSLFLNSTPPAFN